MLVHGVVPQAAVMQFGEALPDPLASHSGHDLGMLIDAMLSNDHLSEFNAFLDAGANALHPSVPVDLQHTPYLSTDWALDHIL